MDALASLVNADRKFLHDVATPLTIALGFANRALEKAVNAEQRDELERVIRALRDIETAHNEHRKLVRRIADLQE